MRDRVVCVAMQLQQTAIPARESGKEVMFLRTVHVPLELNTHTPVGLLDRVVKVGGNDASLRDPRQ
jgi:hypothetical protein